VCAVEDETCLWVSLFPEITKRALLKVYEKSFVLRCEAGGIGLSEECDVRCERDD